MQFESWDVFECCHQCVKVRPIRECSDPGPHFQHFLKRNSIEDIFAFLYASELKHLGGAGKAIRTALKNAPDDIKRRLQKRLRWCHVGGGAQICKRDVSIAFSPGSWSPGGVALADLQVTSDCDVSFRFEVTSRAKKGGDVLLGLTKEVSTSLNDEFLALLNTGYEYILGRGSAPASMFIGAGCARQCGFSRGDGTGPIMDDRAAGVAARMSRLSCVGQWMEFRCKAGLIIATDFTGKQFQWDTRIKEGEVWQPTFAWTGSTASIRIVRQN